MYFFLLRMIQNQYTRIPLILNNLLQVVLFTHMWIFEEYPQVFCIIMYNINISSKFEMLSQGPVSTETLLFCCSKQKSSYNYPVVYWNVRHNRNEAISLFLLRLNVKTHLLLILKGDKTKPTNQPKTPKSRRHLQMLLSWLRVGKILEIAGKCRGKGFPKSQEPGWGAAAAAAAVCSVEDGCSGSSIHSAFRISALISIPLSHYSSNLLEVREIELRVFSRLRQASHTFPHFSVLWSTVS